MTRPEISSRLAGSYRLEVRERIEHVAATGLLSEGGARWLHQRRFEPAITRSRR